MQNDGGTELLQLRSLTENTTLHLGYSADKGGSWPKAGGLSGQEQDKPSIKRKSGKGIDYKAGQVYYTLRSQHITQARNEDQKARVAFGFATEVAVQATLTACCHNHLLPMTRH